MVTTALCDFPNKGIYCFLGGDALINEGAANLLRLSEKIDTDKMEKPAFLMVLCGVAPFAYRREDGVFVVPISCLKD